MGKRFPEYKGLDLSQVNKEILKVWDENDTFHKSVRELNGKGEFVFYEGPPSANGMPGHSSRDGPYDKGCNLPL